MKIFRWALILSFTATILVRADDATEWENYVAASTNDLQRLFKIESNFIDNLDKWLFKVKQDEFKSTSYLKNDVKLVENAFEDLNVYDWRNENEDYVYHPINAFNLLKRTASYWPCLLENVTSPTIDDFIEENMTQFPLLDDFLYGGCVGLVNIELYYDLTVLDLARGKVTDPSTGKIHQAKHRLTSDDCLLVANAAKKVWRFDKYILWIEGAIEVAEKLEGKSSMEIRKLSRVLTEAKEAHDDFLLKYGINPLRDQENDPRTPDGQPSSPFHTALHPFDDELLAIPSYTKAKKKYKAELAVSKPFVNIRPFDYKDGRYMDRSFYRMRTAMLKYSMRLCKGDSTFRDAKYDKGLKCTCLHYGNPYLKIGPFKYEPLNEDPHVGLYRDFFSHDEMDNLVEDSKNKLHSTIFYVS